MMKKLMKEIREIKRKMSLPLKREGSRGMLIPPGFTEREKELMIEMLTRRSKRHPTPGGHISSPMMMHKNRLKRGEGHNEKGQFSKSTQNKAMNLIREGKWVI
jgi:hypothetical protein